MRVLITHVSRYRFQDEAKKELEGGKLSFLDPEMADRSEDRVGLDPMTMSADYEVFAQIKPEQVPGWYDLSVKYKNKKDKQNRTLLTPHATAALHVGGVSFAVVKG